MRLIIIFISLILYSTVSFSQFTTANPDTVCIGTTQSTYQVENSPGYVYTWSVSTPGILTSGQGTNTITVNWSSAPAGTISNGISVFATNEFGCVGDPIFLDVFVLQLVPILEPLVFCEGDPCENIVFSPAGGILSGQNVVGLQYCPDTPGTTTMSYTISEAGCTFTTTADVITNPIPVLQNISHD